MSGLCLKSGGIFLLCWLVLCLTGANAQQKAKQSSVKQDTIRENVQTQQQAYEQLNQFEQRVTSSADLEIDGLVVDETITKLGRDFYDIFHRQWEAPPMAKNFTILIQEKPTRGNGALVSVSINGEVIFEYQLQPKYEVIEEVANYTVSLAYEHLVRDQLNRQLEAEGKGERELY